MPTRLLWTGGWDSTFRLLELLLVEQRAVQPVYVVDTGRRSLVHELRAMESLREQILPRMPEPGLLRPLEIVLATDHPPRRELEDLAQRIRTRKPLGSQYVWLAGVAESLDWHGVEMCIEMADGGGFTGWPTLVLGPDGRLNGSPESELLHRWSFPVSDRTKADMTREAERAGFLDLLLQRWFCFDPFDGKPCGRCYACRTANHDAVKFANRAGVLGRQGARTVGSPVRRLVRHLPGTGGREPVDAASTATGSSRLTGADRPVDRRPQAPGRGEPARHERSQVLWTGGGDSSFRVMQLLLADQVAVQPIYVVDTGRGSLVEELRTIESMRAQILPRLADPELLAPLRMVLRTDHPPLPEHEAIAARIRRTHGLGTQYVWLAAVAEALGWRGVELSAESADDGSRTYWIELVVDEQGRLNDSPEAELFRYWTFPILLLTKPDMRRIAGEHGFLDLLQQRWFCFDPLTGMPCGRCYPCVSATHVGVRFAPRAAVHARRVVRGSMRGVKAVTARATAARAPTVGAVPAGDPVGR